MFYSKDNEGEEENAKESAKMILFEIQCLIIHPLFFAEPDARLWCENEMWIGEILESLVGNYTKSYPRKFAIFKIFEKDLEKDSGVIKTFNFIPCKFIFS